MDRRTGLGPIRRPGEPRARGDGPWETKKPEPSLREPRARGDGPPPTSTARTRPSRAPRTRGWTVAGRARAAARPESPAHAGMDRCGRRRSRRSCESPAHAGMDRPDGPLIGARSREPRARGDGPTWRCSPRISWSRAPRTRGWTAESLPPQPSGPESPAHAGMDRPSRGRPTAARREPRARGDGPALLAAVFTAIGRAPRTRGWTVPSGNPGTGNLESPAHAGMDRGRGVRITGTPREPRARGDGPRDYRPRGSASLRAPRTRGWTGGHGRTLRRRLESPAHAGMDRPRAGGGSGGGGEPRARGDGPL